MICSTVELGRTIFAITVSMPEGVLSVTLAVCLSIGYQSTNHRFFKLLGGDYVCQTEFGCIAGR